MSNPLRTQSLVAVLILSWTAAFGAHAARADEACESLAQYLWNFQSASDSAHDESQDVDLLPARAKVAKTAVLDHAYPFPNMPSAVSTGMDRDTLNKVTGLYDRYVLLDRSISDLWKDRYSRNPLPNAQQKFAIERGAIYQEMSHVAKAAKDEVVRYSFRSRSCFDAYEAFVSSKQDEMRQQLSDAKSTLRANEEIWSHAEAAQADTTNAVGAAIPPTPVGATDVTRTPASSQ